MFKKKYKVNYNGTKDCFIGAKDTYKEGAKVTLYYTIIATNTDYSFYLDDKPYRPDYEEHKGFIISFTMPNHDISIKVKSKNTMI